MLSPVQAALQGDHWTTVRKNTLDLCPEEDQRDRPKRWQDKPAGIREPTYSHLDPIPMHLTEWDCEWEQCVSYPLTTVRVTDSKQQSEVCTYNPHKYHASIWATHSKAITKTIHNINLCGAHKHKATSLFYSIGRCGDCAMNVCHDTSHSCVSC